MLAVFLIICISREAEQSPTKASYSGAEPTYIVRIVTMCANTMLLTFSMPGE